jgi:thioesterase domain-containing protein/SAM-dependent methyltransferase
MSAGSSHDDRVEFLVAVQPLGSRPPIFGVHVLGKNASFYRPLAAALGPDQPVFGLGLADGLEHTAAPADVAEVSRRYADELERCVPTGPVVLAAVSLGSVVAVELANLLLDRGREVLVLALFDAAGPDTFGHGRSTFARLRVHVAELRRDPRHYVGHRVHNRLMIAQRRLEQVERALRSSLHLRLPDRLRTRRFIEDDAQPARAYELQPYAGRITVFTAGDDAFTADRARGGMGWSSVAMGGVEMHNVPGGHLTMLQVPYVSSLAPELRAAIDRATDRQHSRRPGVRSAADVESDLRHALRHDRFAPAVHRLATLAADSPDVFDDAALTLIEQADRATRAIAAGVADEVLRIGAALTAAGVVHRITPVPARLQLAATSIEVDGSPDRAVQIMRSLEYELQDPLGPGAWRAWVAAHGSCTLIRSNEHTTRVHLVWGEDRAGGRVARLAAPRRADLLAVDLPAAVWRAYWFVRPLRLLADRLRGRRRDLGVFLGTPPGLAARVLELAQPTAADLVVDLGCGDARVLIEAAQRFGSRGRGVELDAALVAAARRNVDAAGLSAQVEIVHGDATDPAAVAEATIVFAFLPPDTVTRLVEPTLAALQPGGRLVTHEQLESSWPVEPTASRLLVDDGITVAHLWVRDRQPWSDDLSVPEGSVAD